MEEWWEKLNMNLIVQSNYSGWVKLRPTPDIKDCNRVAKKVALKIKIDANLEVFLWVLMFWGKKLLPMPVYGWIKSVWFDRFQTVQIS